MKPFEWNTKHEWRRRAYRRYLLEELATLFVLLSNYILLIFLWCICCTSFNHTFLFKRLTTHPLLLGIHTTLLLVNTYVSWRWIGQIPIAIYKRVSPFHPLCCTLYGLWLMGSALFLYLWRGST